MKNNLFRKFVSLLLVSVFTVAFTAMAFAETFSANGHTISQSGSNCVIDGKPYSCTGTENAYTVNIGNYTFKCTSAEKEDIKNALATDISVDKKDLDAIRDNAVNEVEGLQQSLGVFAPKISDGLNALGPEAINMIQKVLSVGVGALWIIYLAVLIINGAVILVPGLGGQVSSGSGMYPGAGFSGPSGGSARDKGIGFIKAATWKSTNKIVTGDYESPIKEFIKATIPSMIFMVILTICLFNGLLINVIVFFLKFFK